RALLGQIVLGAAAEDQHVDGLAVLRQRLHGVYRCASLKRGQIGRRAAGEDTYQRHVRVLANGGFDAPPEVAVTGDANTNLLAHEQLLGESKTDLRRQAAFKKRANSTGLGQLLQPD